MRRNLNSIGSFVIVSALSACTMFGQSDTSTTKPVAHSKSSAKRTKKPKPPSTAAQLDEIRRQMQEQHGEVQQLKQQLTEKDTQIQQLQQATAAAQATAQQTQAQLQVQAEQASASTQAVTSLESSVADLKTNATSLVSTVQEDQQKVTKAIENPEVLHYKGITLSPAGSFIAAETVWRQRAIGGDVNTQFAGDPLENTEQAKLSEFYGSGRQSRIAMLAEGKTPNYTMRGYYEADFLSAGVTSNNNQSNSYTLRQRQIWAQAELKSGWTLTGGQMWSLATETRQGLTNRTEALPQTIDAQYSAGFTWERQYGFRVVKQFDTHHVWLGASIENPQTLNVGGRGFPTNFLIGVPGNAGGLYNPTANYASNIAPDVIAKVAYEPTWGGHYEVFGVGRFFRARVYPNATATTPSAIGAFNDSTVGGGIGGSLRVPTFHKKLDVGLKGLWGQGIGRYGSSTLADTTARPTGQLALLHGFSALGTLEYHATPRLDIYANYGGDYAYRRHFLNAKGAPVGYGSPLFVNTGCATEPVPGSGGFTPGVQSNCAADNKDIQEFTLGYWYDFYKGPKGRLRQGIQYSYLERYIWSGIGGAPKGIDNMFFTSFRYYLP